MEGLLPFYEQEQALPSEDEQYAYERDTETARDPFEAMAEDTAELLELLIAHADKVLTETGEVR